MKLLTIAPGVFQVSLGIVNAFIIDDGELTLIDTGTHRNHRDIKRAVEQTGHKITDLKHIILTHCHADHTGTAAILRQVSGATVYAHTLDAPLIEKGEKSRKDKPLHPAPGIFNFMMWNLVLRVIPMPTAPVGVDVLVKDGDTINNKLKVIHTPGHSAGHICLLYQANNGIMFAADICCNLGKISYSIVYEDIIDGKRSITTIRDMEYETICFGHGNPILSGADKAMKAAFYK